MHTIKLTTLKDKKDIFISVDKIIYFERENDPDCTFVALMGGSFCYIKVTEAPEEILRRLCEFAR